MFQQIYTPMDVRKKILFELVTSGISVLEPGLELKDLNDTLRKLDFTVYRWPGTERLILKDLRFPRQLIAPWTEKTSRIVQNGIKNIVLGEAITPDTLNLLLEHKLAILENNRPILSEKTLIQFSEYIISLNGRYRQCHVCSIPVFESDMHPACYESLNSS